VGSIVLDHVVYRASLPWPVNAAGTGFSLQRRNSFEYGNDPANWIGAAPSAAVPNPGEALIQITQQPQSQTVPTGVDATLKVVAQSTGPLTYQWRHNGANVTGATDATLILKNVRTNDAGSYVAMITHAQGGVATQPAILTVTTGPVDTDGDGLPDDWETSHRLDPRDSTGDNGANGDPDGDGVTNFQEYQTGTDPKDVSSVLRITSVAYGSDGATVGFGAVAGRHYRLEYWDLINSPVWTKVTDLVVAQTGPITVVDRASDVQKRFYRVVFVQP
jgi:hypothetical protein